MLQFKLTLAPNGVFPKTWIQDGIAPNQNQQKAHLDAVLKDGPLTGALKLKLMTGLPENKRLIITFVLSVGQTKLAKMTHDFGDVILTKWDKDAPAECDWLKEQEDGALTVGVDILA